MNLWAEFENNQLPLSTSVGTGRTRRLTEQVVLSSLRTWLLEDYAAAYCRALAASRIFRRCYWIDALGGATPRNPSSPLESVQRLSASLEQQPLPLRLLALFLTSSSNKRKGRKTAPPSTAIPKEGGVLAASWSEAGSAILSEIEQTSAICLLNPLGQTILSYESVLPLYQRTVPTELFFLLSHKQIEMHLSSASSTPAQGAGLTALLRSDRWKTLATTEEALSQSVESIVELLVASMQRYFLLPIQRIVLPIQVRPAVVEIVPYTLLFATRRQDSLLSMNDAYCFYRRRVYMQSHLGLLAEAWFAQQQNERLAQQREQVRQHLLQLGRGQRRTRWPDLRQQLLLSHLGQFSTADYDALIQELLAQKEVRCEWSKKIVAEEQNRIPGPQDILLWR